MATHVHAPGTRRVARPKPRPTCSDCGGRCFVHNGRPVCPSCPIAFRLTGKKVHDARG